MNKLGQKRWIIPDGFLPERSNGDFVSHEAICVLNIGEKDANLKISIYFEDCGPMEDFIAICGAKRTNHIRLDQIQDQLGQKIPIGVPYAIKIDSDEPIIVQHSRMDTSQAEMTLMTTMAYPLS